MNYKKTYFENLDSIRFIAATMVYMQHGVYGAFSYLNIEDTFIGKLINIFSRGWVGVSIFFVLSGFLITYLLIEEHQLNGKISVRKFYIRRVLRIWPLYFLIVCFSFFIYPYFKFLIGGEYYLKSNLLYYLFFLSNFDVINTASQLSESAMIQNITWSVSIEEQFYLFWPLIFLLIPKRIWYLPILLVVLGSVLFRIYHYDNSPILNFHTFSVLLDLGLGGLFAYFIKFIPKFSLFFENNSSFTKGFYFFLSLTILYFYNIKDLYIYGGALIRLFTSLSFVLIISSQAMTKSNSFFNLKNLSFANKWGKYTYGIYLIHPIALLLVNSLVKYFHIPQNNFLNVFMIGITGFLLTLFLSKLSYNYYESKFLGLKNKFS